MKPKYLSLFLIWCVLVVLVLFHPLSSDFPKTFNIGLRAPADHVQTWLITHRHSHPIFTYFFEPLNSTLDMLLKELETLLLGLPALVIIIAVFLAANKVADFRTAVLCALCLLMMGLFGLWEKSIQTLTLILLSVFFSLAIGIPLGIAMAFSRHVERIVRPLLDAMQTLPTFVYLIPAILFFGVAGVPSLVATIIYAVPPAARLTYLGIRHVPEETLEAGVSFGSTRRQLLYKVQLPMALPSIMAGVNQTIMMALSMVCITALIGAGGLGREVLFALRRLKVGSAFEAGLAVVAMAILLDRLSYGFSQVEAPTQLGGSRLQSLERFSLIRRIERWIESLPRPTMTFPSATPSFVRNHVYGLGSLLFLAMLTSALSGGNHAGFPENWRWSMQKPIDDAVVWAQTNLYEIGDTSLGTGPFSDFLTINLLLPLRDLLQQDLPWGVLILLVTALALVISDWKLAMLSIACLLFIGLMGMWEEAMDTLSQVIIAVAISILIGIPIGILAARVTAVDRLLRPVLDTLQTIPPFVYLVPMIMLFNLGRVPGVVASILYALPPVIRLTSLGIRQVDKTVMEAARSFGSSSFQLLYKVQLPLALPSIMMGINQTVMMVLAMVVVAGLVGGSGLGFEVVTALAQNELGRGLEAGLAIVAMAVVLDRLTQAWSARRVSYIAL